MATAVRKPKLITKKEDIDWIIETTEDDITFSYLMKTFGTFNGKVRFNPYDEIDIPKGKYGVDGLRNIESFHTTVGIFLWNRFFIEKDFLKFFGYINENIDSDKFDDLNADLSCLYMEEDITQEQFKRYLMKTQKITPIVSIIAPNYTEKMLTLSTHVEKKKNELLKKYEKGIDEGDPAIATKMEQELLKWAVDYMGDDPSMDMFISGARGTIGNNFKNMFVMKGVIKDPDPNAKQKYRVATSNYMNGIKAEEYSLFSNSLAAGPFSRARKTAIGGYLEKLFLYAFQHVRVDAPGTDCGTTRTISVQLTKKNYGKWIYSYIVEKGKLVELTSKNREKYVGKTVKLRFSGLCQCKKGGTICHTCMGNFFARRGTTNVGIETTIIASTMKNTSMKAFHDSVQKMYKIDLDSVFPDE